MSAINNSTFNRDLFSGTIPDVPTEIIFSYLQARDLGALRGGRRLNENAVEFMSRALKGIEASLEYSAKEEEMGLRFRKYYNKVEDLIGRVKKYPDCQKPEVIENILKAASDGIPTDAEVKLLNEFRKARDTLVVWEKIAQQARIDKDFSKAFVSADAAITEANEFSQWMIDYSESLGLRVRDLNLNGGELTTLPPEIEKLKSLVSLELNNNQFTRLPAEIGNLSGLQVLGLKDNQLTTLPSEIEKLSGLQMLGLSNNQLTTLPSFEKLTHLTFLGLNKNLLTSLPPGIEKLSDLQSLELSWNQLTTRSIEEIGGLTSLVKLELKHNQLTSIPEEIRTLPNLRRFEHGDNPIPYMARLNLFYRQFSLSDVLSSVMCHPF